MFQVQQVNSFTDWSRLISDTFVRLRSEQIVPGDFSARLGANMLGNIGLMQVQAKAHAVQRTEDLSASGDGDFFKVSYQLSGHGLLIQDGRETVLKPGELAIYDTQRPYTLAFDQPASVMVVLIPHREFKLSTAQVSQVTATTLNNEHPLTGAAAPLLEHLAKNLPAWDEHGGWALAHQTVDFLATAVGGLLETGEHTDPKDFQRERIRQYICAHLAQPDLTPQSVAQAHFMSLRALHTLFEHEPLTVAAFIRRERLEQAARTLADPQCADKTVHGIAESVGLTDAAGFTRLFTKHFGMTPGRYRTQAGL